VTETPETLDDFDEADDDALEEVSGSEVLPAEVAEEETRALLPGEPEAEDLMERSRNLLERMHVEDREEAIDLHEKIGTAIEFSDAAALEEAARALLELLFFVEGRPN
jgi:GGDEF domain-containing protein